MRIVLAIGFVMLSACFVFGDDDRIWLENAKVDGKDVKMAFDSGFSFVGLTSQAVKRLGLKIVVPPTNGMGDTANYSAEFDGVPFSTDFAIMHFSAMVDIDGLIGWGVLNSNIFRIDAEAQKLTVLSQVPAGIKGWTELLINTNAETLDLEVPGKRREHNTITVDTGSAFGIELTTREWKQWKKTHPYTPITMEGYLTIDGIYVGEESWADKIQIGPLTLYDVPIMEEGPSTPIELGSERDVLGIAALRRLDLVVDGIHGVAYLRAKQTPPRPYSYNRLGAGFIPTATDSNDLVAQVVAGSPAFEAGIRNGDILLKIDGKSVSSWATNAGMESGTFSMPAGTKVQIKLQRDKRIFETTATLREILQPSHRKYEAKDDSKGLSELDAQIYYDRAFQKESEGDTNGALSDYNKAIEMNPEFGDAYSRRACLEQSNSNLDAALADYNKAINLGAASAEDYGNCGMVEQNKGDVTAALADYNKAVEMEPAWAEIYAYRGTLEQRKSQFDAALADFNKAIKLEPDLAEAYAYRGWLEQQKKEFNAIADYENALKLKPDLTWIKPYLASLYGYRGSMEQRTNGFDAALADYRKAIELEPTDDNAHFDVWLCNSSLGNSERATGELKAYLSTRGFKDSGDWPSEVGRFLVGQVTDQDFLSAAKSADAKKDKEQHCEAYYYIGAKRLIAGDKTGAVTEFQKCLGTNVQNFNEYQFAKAELQLLKVGN